MDKKLLGGPVTILVCICVQIAVIIGILVYEINRPQWHYSQFATLPFRFDENTNRAQIWRPKKGWQSFDSQGNLPENVE